MVVSLGSSRSSCALLPILVTRLGFLEPVGKALSGTNEIDCIFNFFKEIDSRVVGISTLKRQ